MKYNYKEDGEVEISGVWRKILEVDPDPPDDMYVCVSYPEDKEHRKLRWASDGFIQGYRPPQKTVEEWLQTLPDGYRERALANINNDCANDKTRSLIGSLSFCFSWGDTPEGTVFWKQVADWARDPESNNLPPLPEDEPEEWISESEWDAMKSGCICGTRSNGKAVIEAVLKCKYGPPPKVRVYNGEPPERFGLSSKSYVFFWHSSQKWLTCTYGALANGERWMKQPKAPEQ